MLADFQRAPEIDPGYARALAMAALGQTVRPAMGWPLDVEQEKVRCNRWIRRALQLDSRDSFVLPRAACVTLFPAANGVTGRPSAGTPR